MRRSMIVLAVLAATFSSSAGVAGARTGCAFSAKARLLRVVVSRGGIGIVQRRGNDIVVKEFLSRSQDCRGQVPTVHNTDKIKIIARGESFADVRIGGGGFAPGATREPDGASEIEIEGVSKDFLSSVTVVGSNHPDVLRYGLANGVPGVNLNPHAGDRDIDLTTRGPGGLVWIQGATAVNRSGSS